jgi:hypothetical protein
LLWDKRLNRKSRSDFALTSFDFSFTSLSLASQLAGGRDPARGYARPTRLYFKKICKFCHFRLLMAGIGQNRSNLNEI